MPIFRLNEDTTFGAHLYYQYLFIFILRRNDCIIVFCSGEYYIALRFLYVYIFKYL